MNNVYIERSLSQMHRENLRREVHANRSAKRLRTSGRGPSVWQPSGFFSLGLRQVLPERAAGS